MALLTDLSPCQIGNFFFEEFLVCERGLHHGLHLEILPRLPDLLTSRFLIS